VRPELFDQPERVGRLPSGGFFSISLAPALAVVAAVSPRCRARCISFLNAQIELTAERLAPSAKAAPETERELIGLLRASVALRTSLQNAPPGAAQPHAAEVEAWLGLV
jgi:hypothetical protein